MRNFITTILLVASVSVGSCEACDKFFNPDLYPNGPSTMSAVINGKTVSFSFKDTPQYYLGLGTRGTGGQYTLGLYMDLKPGTYTWRSGMSPNYVACPDADLNGIDALKDVGSLTVTDESFSGRYVRGSFEFAVVDTTGDTTFIKSGKFDFNFINGR